ncbi:DUF5710 domain-containing protein [Brucella intermedia]|uniref:DUF5710 domain-containing protein n=1 Tax=Brucella intermedia TaxID=94625 RepID=UPI00209AF7E3|nr:DUF5710 domain-containing protein [Brucella intermedia]MCO7729092.1 DUF5710 domain-containing protein [Brucella intermedia]
MKEIINLNVPFGEKDEGKRAGARWNPGLRSWFITADAPLRPFEKWLPEPLRQQVINQREHVEQEDRKVAEWNALPPRSEDPLKLLKLIKVRPVKIKTGFCGMCDSAIKDEWCLSTKKPHYEIRHLAERSIGVLRPSELPIIIAELERQSKEGLVSRLLGRMTARRSPK